MIGTGTERERLYYLDQAKEGTCNSVHTHNPNLWHQRLGHPLSKISTSFSFSLNKFCNTDKCSICPLAKQTRLFFPLSSISSESRFDLIHVNIWVWGVYHEPTFSGAKYSLTIVDDYTRSIWVYLMKHKSETLTLLISFIHMVDNQFRTKVKIVDSDNGLEFKLGDFYAIKGIIHQSSCINIPQ